MKVRCAYCDEMAVWFYMPATEDDGWDMCRCDDHVPRGCSCNHHDEAEMSVGELYKYLGDGMFAPIDEKEREFPCCEWVYDKEGEEYNETDIVTDKRKKVAK